MGSERYHVRVTKDHLVFSAAHFITFNGNVCERLHGHNWRVAVEVEGPLDENFYVVDFIALRDATQVIVNELDHRMLLPTRHRMLQVTAGDREVEAKFADRRWVFPREDCILLPIENTTTELIARWIGERLVERLNLGQRTAATTIRIEVEENFGQSATCEMSLDEGRGARGEGRGMRGRRPEHK